MESHQKNAYDQFLLNSVDNQLKELNRPQNHGDFYNNSLCSKEDLETDEDSTTESESGDEMEQPNTTTLTTQPVISSSTITNKPFHEFAQVSPNTQNTSRKMFECKICGDSLPSPRL